MLSDKHQVILVLLLCCYRDVRTRVTPGKQRQTDPVVTNLDTYSTHCYWVGDNMSKSKGDALYQLNAQRESWCRVEADSKFWTPTERRHFSCHLQTTYNFKSPHAQRPDQRSSWIGGVVRLPERKHFEENNWTHLV
ncbi:hypothetical protein ANANG_G00116580 [Anguilla anguilla]|uniref:Uncharacterized protein n=1 Tax=Anguilla anguilla TaxID=7936 RepID=A0A9D3MFI7_ANGAN|nr:hypothetical protein ANANG_G00116580 [Anguilla anguilla]